MENTFTGFNRVQRLLLTMAAFVVVVAGIRAAQDILVPFLLSLFITIIAYPLLKWLRTKKIPTSLAIFLVIFFVAMAGILLASLVGSSLRDFSASIPAYQASLKIQISEFIVYLQSKGVDVSSQLILDYFNPGSAMRLTSKLLTGLGNTLGDTVIILLIVVFMLLETATFGKKLEKALGGSGIPLNSYYLFIENINKYMVIKTSTSFATGLIASIWLSILGVNYALLWGLLTFLLNYVPNIGSIMAAIPPVLIALILQGPFTSLAVAVGYIVLNIGIGSFLEPRLMGRGLGLSTLVVFLSLLFWGWVMGPLGMLLSVPLTMTLKIALTSFEETQWISVLLDAAPSRKKKKSKK
jgi:AI-2 transport protein TqsA